MTFTMIIFPIKFQRYFRGPVHKQVTSLAWPAVMVMVSHTLVMIADTIMVGKLGPAAIAATGAAGVLFHTILTLFIGGSMGLQIVVSHRTGESDLLEAGRNLGTGIWISVITGGLFSITGSYFSELLMRIMTDDPAVLIPGSSYLVIRFASSLPLSLIFILRGFFDGTGDTRPGMISSFAVAFSNILMNIVFIFGWKEAGIPAMGVSGAAVASLLSTIPGLISFVPFFRNSKIRKFFKGVESTVAINRKRFAHLIKLSVPPAMEHSLMHLSFVVFTMLAARNGIEVLAATQIIVAILSLSFMPGFAFAIATTTIVGQALGRHSPARALAGTYRSLYWALSIMITGGIIFVVFSNPILRIFTSDPAVIREAYFALIVVAIVQPFDAMNMIFAAVLRSAGFVKWVFWVNIILSWTVMLPLSYLGAVLIGGSAPMWSAVSLWIVLMAGAYGYRFYRGDWKKVEDIPDELIV